MARVFGLGAAVVTTFDDLDDDGEWPPSDTEANSAGDGITAGDNDAKLFSAVNPLFGDPQAITPPTLPHTGADTIDLGESKSMVANDSQTVSNTSELSKRKSKLARLSKLKSLSRRSGRKRQTSSDETKGKSVNDGVFNPLNTVQNPIKTDKSISSLLKADAALVSASNSSLSSDLMSQDAPISVNSVADIDHRSELLLAQEAEVRRQLEQLEVRELELRDQRRRLWRVEQRLRLREASATNNERFDNCERLAIAQRHQRTGKLRSRTMSDSTEWSKSVQSLSTSERFRIGSSAHKTDVLREEMGNLGLCIPIPGVSSQSDGFGHDAEEGTGINVDFVASNAEQNSAAELIERVVAEKQRVERLSEELESRKRLFQQEKFDTEKQLQNQHEQLQSRAESLETEHITRMHELEGLARELTRRLDMADSGDAAKIAARLRQQVALLQSEVAAKDAELRFLRRTD